MAVRDADTCAMCGQFWPELGYCPDCQAIVDEIEACPWCGGSSADPGEICPACEDERDEHLREEAE